MSATAAQITRVRMLSGVTVSDYDDATVTISIEQYPLYDSEGRFQDHTDWEATYDLYAAAADIVDMRATEHVMKYDTSADGANLSRSQMFSQLQSLAKRLRCRCAPKVKRSVNTMSFDDDSGNISLPEDEDE